jgi:ubiquinone/menaquinone biosynthesis C-methylase UbiE
MVDYDAIAAEYDRRYALHDYPGVRSAIRGAVAGARGNRVLEVGCGTGRWLAELARTGADVAGIDPSEEMLLRASTAVRGDLRRGVAEALPWPEASFDVTLFVNSLHHVGEPEVALREAFRVLRPGGTLLSVGLDPHEGGDRWYVYEFFPEALALDRRRFPPRERRVGWLTAAGFTDVGVPVAERLGWSKRLDEALADGVLERSFTSQLTALSDAEYAAGRRRIRAAADRDPQLRVEVGLSLYATEARKPAGPSSPDP